MASSTIKMPNDKYYTTPTITSSRAELTGGGYTKDGYLIVTNLKIKAITTLTNSPQVATLPAARVECALSCIDITSGIGTAITEAIPCGVSTDGKLYIKSITANHIYAITGTYVTD